MTNRKRLSCLSGSCKQQCFRSLFIKIDQSTGYLTLNHIISVFPRQKQAILSVFPKSDQMPAPVLM
ncbi:MAG: hypothetical protein PUK64_10250, partial [bacterium]|nr:hypothetical protein [bacterium]